MAKESGKEKVPAGEPAPIRRAPKLVHYVEDGGRHIEAIVMEAKNETVADRLSLFPPGGHNTEITNVQRDDAEKKPGTWHVIEK